MRLGLGLGIPKRVNIINSYTGPLDELGVTENCVFTFSPLKRLTTAYKDELIRVNAVAGMTSKYFGPDRSGNIDENEVMSWLDGDIGVIDWTCNERKASNPSTQSNLSNCPQISDGTNFQENGLKFNQSANKYLTVTDYTEIQLTTAPFSIYANFYPTAADWGILCNKHAAGNINITQFRISTAAGNRLIYQYLGNNYTNSSLSVVNAVNKYMCNYLGSGTNEVITTNNSDTDYNTNGATISNRDTFVIGSASFAFIGNIKTIVLFNSNEFSNYSNIINSEL